MRATGGALSMGIGIIQGKASKQKLNSKSSTKTEVVVIMSPDYKLE